ncbi:MAG: SOS response-associated peptidase [Burkholderiales bacterium]|nr:SOS response-associated peptidase [Burkholderiales bacterium]
MCGRYVSPEQAAIERQWHIGRHNQPNLSEPFAARYNVAPQQGNPKNFIPVVRQSDSDELELVQLQWWLLPFWSKEPRIKYSTFNARIETVAKAASFRDPLKRRRCVIPALGWYEWQELPSGKLPWYLHSAKGELLAFAGVWDRWQGTDGAIESCSIIVGPANSAFGKIHDRMPFVIPPDRAGPWLDRDQTDADKAMELLLPNPDDAIAFHRVSTRVSNARNQGADLIDAV